ncbi:hypothetical protein DP116_07225 [Brasilonema bromeliae SPC951]|uniref:Uncharacterized protein n=1 Tax=Brasilonema bromeliae SPC951 TaxID=385972 RepID=A0ABX1P4J0_9CYAN|nr:hypothetical protein [Brasilonema bromeliae SPC951]
MYPGSNPPPAGCLIVFRTTQLGVFLTALGVPAVVFFPGTLIFLRQEEAVRWGGQCRGEPALREGFPTARRLAKGFPDLRHLSVEPVLEEGLPT